MRKSLVAFSLVLVVALVAGGLGTAMEGDGAAGVEMVETMAAVDSLPGQGPNLRFWSCQDCWDAYNACTVSPSSCQLLLNACLARLGCN